MYLEFLLLSSKPGCCGCKLGFATHPWPSNDCRAGDKLLLCLGRESGTQQGLTEYVWDCYKSIYLIYRENILKSRFVKKCPLSESGSLLGFAQRGFSFQEIIHQTTEGPDLMGFRIPVLWNITHFESPIICNSCVYTSLHYWKMKRSLFYILFALLVETFATTTTKRTNRQYNPVHVCVPPPLKHLEQLREGPL